MRPHRKNILQSKYASTFEELADSIYGQLEDAAGDFANSRTYGKTAEDVFDNPSFWTDTAGDLIAYAVLPRNKGFEDRFLGVLRALQTITKSNVAAQEGLSVIERRHTTMRPVKGAPSMKVNDIKRAFVMAFYQTDMVLQKVLADGYMPVFKRALIANLRSLLRDTPSDDDLRGLISDLRLTDPVVASTTLEELLSTLYEGADKAASDRLLASLGDDLFSAWYIENQSRPLPMAARKRIVRR